MSELDVSEELTADLLVRFLRSEAGKFGFDRVVCGLSGGVDSAVSVGLAARAFGPENVLGVMMPYRTSNPSSEADARVVAEAVGIETRKVDITFQQVISQANHACGSRPDNAFLAAAGFRKTHGHFAVGGYRK